MTQPSTKAQSAFDWLCYVLVIFGGLCLVASLPQTFTMVRVAHDEFGSSILVVVLEVMAFFALLAPLWVPAWTKTFDRIAYTLLGITTLGNYAGGWNYVWTHNEMGPFWMGIRDWREPIFGLPLATILLVGTLSGLVPFAMKFFISLAIKRYRENELDRSPDAVAQRAIEPVLVQIIATQRLQERLLALTEQTKQPLILPANSDASFERMRADAAHQEVELLRARLAALQEGEQRHPFEPLGLSPDEQGEVWQAVRKAQVSVDRWQADVATAQADHIDQLMMDGEPSQAVTEASDEDDWGQDWSEENGISLEQAQDELAHYGWERLSWEAMDVLPDSDEKAAEIERRRLAREKLKQSAIQFATDIGLLKPKTDVLAADAQEDAGIAEEEGGIDGMGKTAEPVLRASAPAVNTWECSGCKAEGSNGSKGVAKKWSAARNLGDALYCGDCRKSGKYGK